MKVNFYFDTAFYGFMLFPHPLFLPKKRLPSEGFGGVAYRCGIVSEGSGGVMHRYGGIPEASAGAAYRYGSIPEGLAGAMQGCVVTFYCSVALPLSS